MKSQHKIKEWRERSKEALSLTQRDLREKLRSLRFLLVSGKLKNTQEVKELKKDVARLATLLNSNSSLGENQGSRGATVLKNKEEKHV
ncbi:MAG: 50S ribosomal protein L29 [Candidatus Nealsonbacteria bacterium]|nr:50S ribosomal protein L29 [Candidatus Nealsonbacteria bacterium]